MALELAEPAVARRLLGSVLRRGDAAGLIVETEFYDESDPASHTFGGPTPRNRPMYDRAGTLYVYRSYGVHWCANVVVGQVGRGSAVLLRALEPLVGTEVMEARRPRAKKVTDLCSGPGKLCAALAITGEHSGLDLFAEGSAVRLDLRDPIESDRIAVGPRVGISSRGRSSVAIRDRRQPPRISTSRPRSAE